MTELELEVTELERDIDEMLRKSAKFKKEFVTNRSKYDIERIKGKIKAKEAQTIPKNLIFSILGICVGFIMSNISGEASDFDYINIIILLVVIGGWIVLINLHKRELGNFEHCLHLIDMLLDRK